MKSIRVMFDEALLARLDASEEVRREGRSAVLRRAAEEFLHRRQQEMIAKQYREAYLTAPAAWTNWPAGVMKDPNA